jgi:hypothetical protein
MFELVYLKSLLSSNVKNNIFLNILTFQLMVQEVGYSTEIEVIYFEFLNPRRPMSLEPQSSAVDQAWQLLQA